MLLRLITGLTAIAMLSLSACKDDADSMAPEIVFISPPANYGLQVPDSVLVQADIHDDNVIRSVTVTLVDENYIPRTQGATFYPDAGSFLLSASIPVTDKNLSGGRYYFLVTAADGYNTKKEYLEISLQEFPREVKGFIAVCFTPGGGTTVNALDDSYLHDTSFLLPDGYTLGVVQASWEYFIYATNAPSVLTTLTFPGFEPAWEFAAEPPRPSFTGLVADKELVFSTANGDAAILNGAGNIVLRTALVPQQTIACLAADEQYIYAEITDLGQSVREITVFYRVSGAVKYAKRHGDAIIGILPADGKALLVSNEDGKGKLSLLDPENLEITYSNKTSDQPYHLALKAEGEHFLLFTGDEVYTYNPAADLLGNYLEGSYQSGRYDDLGGLLYLVSGNRVEVRAFSPGTLLHTIDIPETIVDFHIVYNK